MAKAGSRFELGKMDGEDVQNGLLKVPGFDVLHNKRLLDGDTVMLTLEVKVDGKKGITHATKNSTLTRIHNTATVRVAVIEEADLLDRVMEFWLNRPDDVGTEPMQFPGPDDDQSDTAIVDDMADDMADAAAAIDVDDLSTHLDDMPSIDNVTEGNFGEPDTSDDGGEKSKLEHLDEMLADDGDEPEAEAN